MPYSANRPRHAALEPKEDYYTILGVRRDASLEQIAEAYRRLVRKCHPDVKPDDSRAEEQFIKVQTAFEVLSDSVKRAAYNRASISFATTYRLRPSTAKPRRATAEPGPATEAIQRATQAIRDFGGSVKYGPTGVAEVYFAGKSTTDDVLVHLQGLEQLQELGLYNTQVTDAGLVPLQGLRELRSLTLSHTQVTDAGLVHLQGLSQLQALWLDNTKVTDQGVKKLHQALPNCVIVH